MVVTSTRGLLPFSVEFGLNMIESIDGVIWSVTTVINEIDIYVAFGRRTCFALLA